MNKALRFSLILNGILFLSFAAAGIFAVRQAWDFSVCRDGRPEGPQIILAQDYPVYERLDGKPIHVFTLPKGTTLQESTPQGAATLGKHYGREYILIIHSYDSSFHPPDRRKNLGWMDRYYSYNSDSDPEHKPRADKK